MGKDTLKLNLGSGNHPLEGYTNVDLDPRADVQTDVRDLRIFEDDSAEEIVASHLIEHFYLWEVQDILAEWKRVLKPGGSIYLECPNIKNCMLMYLFGGFIDRYHMWGLYGDPNHENPLMCHKWGYTPESLAHELEMAGFINIGQSPVVKVAQRDMRLVATKPNE